MLSPDSYRERLSIGSEGTVNKKYNLIRKIISFMHISLDRFVAGPSR